MLRLRPLLVALLLVPSVLIGICLGKGHGQGTTPARPGAPVDAVQQAQTPQAVPPTRPEQRKTPHDQQDPGKTAPPAAATETQPDQGQGLGFDFARDPFNAKRPMQTAEEMMQAEIAEKPALTAAQRRLLESRYDLTLRLDPAAKMSRGKALPVGPTDPRTPRAPPDQDRRRRVALSGAPRPRRRPPERGARRPHPRAPARSGGRGATCSDEALGFRATPATEAAADH
jgi:hypothetical protein